MPDQTIDIDRDKAQADRDRYKAELAQVRSECDERLTLAESSKLAKMVDDLTAELTKVRKQLAETENTLDAFDLDGKIAVTLTVTGHNTWGGYVTVTGFETEQTANEIGDVLTRALASHTGATVMSQLWRRPVPGSSRRAQESAATCKCPSGLCRHGGSR